MKFDVLTLFPEMFEPVKQSILGRAEENKLIEVNLINIRDFSENKHKKVDEDSDEESYVGVDDEEILNKVFQIFKEKYKDDFNFVDED